MTQPTDLQDKEAWCEFGESLEREFLEGCWISGASVARNLEKKWNKYTFDCTLTVPADVKHVGTEFRTAYRYGVDPKWAVTLNNKDVKRYAEKYPGIVIIFNVQHKLYQGVHFAPLSQIKKIIESGAVKTHFYLQRQGDLKNASHSWVLDIRWFPRSDGTLIK